MITFSSATLSGLFLHELVSDTINQKYNIKKEAGKTTYKCDLQQDHNNAWTCSIFCDCILIGQAKGNKKILALCQAFELAVDQVNPSNLPKDGLSKIQSLNTVSRKSNDYPVYVKKKKVGEILLLLNICMKERGLAYTTDIQQDSDGWFNCSIFCNSVLVCYASDKSRCNAMRLAAGGAIDTLLKVFPLDSQSIKSIQEVTSNNNIEVMPNQNEVISNNKQEVTSENKQDVTSGNGSKQVAALNDSNSDLHNDDAESLGEETKDNGTELYLDKRLSIPSSPLNIPFNRRIPPLGKFPQRILFPHQRTIPAFMQHLPVTAPYHNVSSPAQKMAYNRTPVRSVAPQPVDHTVIPSQVLQITKTSEPVSTSNFPPSSIQSLLEQPKFPQKQKQVPKKVNKQSEILQRLDTCMKEHNLEYAFELEHCPNNKYVCTVYCNSEQFIHIKGKDKLTIRYLALQQAIAKVRKIYGYNAAKSTLNSAIQETNDANIDSSSQQNAKENVSFLPTQTKENANEEDLIFDDNDMDLCDEDDGYSESKIELPSVNQYHSFLNKNAYYGSFNGECSATGVTQHSTSLTATVTLQQVYQSEDSATLVVSTATHQNSSFHLDKDISLEPQVDSFRKEHGFIYWQYLKQLSDLTLFHRTRGKDAIEAQTLALQEAITKLKKSVKIKEEPPKDTNKDLATLVVSTPTHQDSSFKLDKDINLEPQVDSCKKERGFTYRHYLKQLSDLTLFHRSRGKDAVEAQTLALQEAITKLKKSVKIKEEPPKDVNDIFTVTGPDKPNLNINLNQNIKTEDGNIAPNPKNGVTSGHLKQARSDCMVNVISKESKKDDQMDVKQEKPSGDILLKNINRPYDITADHGTNHGVSSSHLKQGSSSLMQDTKREDSGSTTENSLSKQSVKREEIMDVPDATDLVTSNNLQQESCDPNDNYYAKWFAKVNRPLKKDIVTPKTSDVEEKSFSKQSNKRERSISPIKIKEIKKKKIHNFILLEGSKFKQNDPYSILRRSATFNNVDLWPKFQKIEGNERTKVHKCLLMIGDEILAEAEGATSGEAQFKASVLALAKLKSHKSTVKIFSHDT